MQEILKLASGAALEAWADDRLREARDGLDRIRGVTGSRTPDDTLRPLDRIVRDLGDARRGIGLLRSVHPEDSFRLAAETCEQKIAEFFTALSLDRGIYEAAKSCDTGRLDAVGRRMHEHLLRDFHRSGVDRDEDTRRRVAEIRAQLVRLGQQFARNILTDVRRVELSGPEELEGLPDDYIRDHAPGDDGKITISTDYPDYNPFMSYAKSEARRRELHSAFRNRAWPDNHEILRQILAQRHDLATVLGYAHWADYVAEDKMIRDADSIRRFIARVRDAAGELSSIEYERLLARKRRDDPGASEVHDWEKAYFEERLRTETFEVDSRELRPYFEYASTLRGVFRLVERLFGVEFRASTDTGRWHPDVEVWDVIEGGELAGRVYLDMHPREGKFKHAAMFPLIQGVRGGPAPEAALVCNFPRPGASGGPALLEHDDVVTFFHEFGHLLHHLFGRDTEWVEFSGTGTEWDFVEVPSQLFEEWAWDPEVLADFARHTKTGEVIPAALVERLRTARDFGRGLQARQQMYYASLSLACHDRDPDELDIGELEESLHNEYSRFRFVPGTHFHASFGHLDGYSALYYTYMWSLVIEKELASRFRESGMLDRELADSYRRTILAPGGSKDAAQLIRDFLGRDYEFTAFEEWLAPAAADRD